MVPGTGAYGLRLGGAPGIEPFLVDAPAGWVRLELRCETAEVGRDREAVDDTRAELLSANGAAIDVDRGRGAVTFTAPWGPTDEEIVHPYLASVASVVAYWHDRESVHAGAFATARGAWAIVGEREVGKSATLAALAARGVPIVADDLLVLDGENVLAGPRAIDLREDAAAALDAGEALGVVGTRERWRVRIAPVAAELPLAGWAFLEWGEQYETATVPIDQRLARLLPQRGIRLPPRDPAVLLELARAPGIVLRRPRGFERLDAALDLLLEATA